MRMRARTTAARVASLAPTRLELSFSVAAEFRAVVVTSDGAEVAVMARVEFPDGARAMLLAAPWRAGASILGAVRDIGLACLARVGAERLLAASAVGETVAIQASVEDVRRVLGSD
jgi:hypothetical protein